MKVYLTRRYRFAAAHRLHNEQLSSEENALLYGKCNNPLGHGHNYTLEVTVAGPIDPRTGMVMNLVDLDGAVEQEVLERFDHMHLNLDVEEFRSKIPTTENLCREVFALLKPPIENGNGASRVKLERVRLEETSSNFFECTR